MTAQSGTPFRVVVNVDDLGLHPAVRRAVESCAARGSVTSASVLANGPDLAGVRPVQGVSLGAHLNALRGVPISPAHEVRSLVDGRGRFLGSYARFAARVLAGTIDLSELRLEWSRQVAVLRDRGLLLSHVDGEKHTHCLPRILSIACEVAAEHGIPFVRRSVELYSAPRIGAGMLRRTILNAMCRRQEVRPPLRRTTAVWGISAQGDALRLARFLREIEPKARAGASIEVVCHPGVPHRGDPALPESFGRMRVASLWEPEYQALHDEPWREEIQARGWSIVGFEDL